MKNSPLILASALALGSCVSKEEPAPQTPVVDLDPAASEIRDAENPAAAPAQGDENMDGSVHSRRWTSDMMDPLIDEQQNLWACISQVDETLFLDCAEQIAASADCYDKGIGRIISRNGKYRDCREAGLERKNANTSSGIARILAAEKKCIDEIRESDPSALNGLIPCYRDEMACLRAVVREKSLVCSEDDQEKETGL